MLSLDSYTWTEVFAHEYETSSDIYIKKGSIEQKKEVGPNNTVFYILLIFTFLKIWFSDADSGAQPS